MKKNISLQRKAILRRPFSLAMVIIGILLYTAAMIYFLYFSIQEGNYCAFYFPNNVMLVGLFLNIFLIFFSFENFFILRRFSESVCITKKGIRDVHKKTLLNLVVFVFVLFAEAVITTIIAIGFAGQMTAEMIFLSIRTLIIYVFLSGLASVFVGYILSLIKIRVIPYILMVVFALTETDLMNQLSAGFGARTNFDITKILKFFCLVPSNVQYTPNFVTGPMLELDEICQILFFIFLGVSVFFISRYISKKKKKDIACVVISIVLTASTLIGYLLPYSSLQSGRAFDGQSKDITYYKNYSPEEQEPDFKVKEYDLTFSFLNCLNAVADVKLDTVKDKYAFTLYHDYKVKRVVDKNNIKLDFTQDKDVLFVDNSTKTDEIVVYYNGGHNLYYSNVSDVFLPGYFAYYPVPGINNIFYDDKKFGNRGYDDTSLSYDVQFNVELKHYKDVYCNLSNEKSTQFSGKAKSLTLISGYINKKTVNGCNVFYPKYATEYTDDYVNEYTKKICSKNKEVRNIFVVPTLHTYSIDIMKIDDSFLTLSLSAIDNTSSVGIERYMVPSSKLNLLAVVEIYLDSKTDEYSSKQFDKLKTDKNKEISALAIDVENALKGDTDGKRISAIKEYLMNKNENSET